MIQVPKNLPLLLCGIAVLLFSFCEGTGEKEPAGAAIEWWITSADRKMLLKQQPTLTFEKAGPSGAVIEIDTTRRYQSMDGFGFSLTGGSAFNIMKLTPEKRS